jgi:hypothetical protein
VEGSSCSRDRHPVARLRHSQRDQAVAEDRLQPLFTGSRVPRPEAGGSEKRRDRSLEHARADQHAAHAADGHSRAARGVGQAVRERRVYGVYTLVEGVDKDFLKRVFGDNDGYLFSYEWAFPYFFSDRGTDTAAYVPSPFSPETHEDDPEPQAIVELVQAINHSTNFASDVNTYLDVKKFVRHVAVENFLADRDDFNGDYGMANFFLYRLPTGDSSG